MALNRRSSARFEGGAARVFPFLVWLPLVNRATLRADLMAALTGAMIMIPQGVAFATIAGMPPEYGLYAGMIPAIIAALFGSSWHLVSGPTTAASVIIFSSISVLADPGTPDYVTLVLTLTFMVGVIELAMGIARLGVLINFISHTVAIGFTAGAAILIAASQARDFFGVEIPRGEKFYEVAISLVRQFDQISIAATVVGLTAIATGLIVKRINANLPHMIIAMLVSAALAFGLKTFGIAEVATIGEVGSGIPSLSSPNFSIEMFSDLALTAFAVALFALTEAVSIARSIAMRTGQQIDGNQEFIGQGLSNLFGGFFSGYVATGSFNRSALNFSSGARTPLAAAAAGVILLVITPFVAPFAFFLPKATVAGILFLVVSGLIDIPHIRQILKSSRSETAIMLVTFFSVLFLNLEVAIFAGVILSLVFYLNRTSHPKVTTMAPGEAGSRRRFSNDPRLPECPQVKIVRIDGSLFFGAISNVIGDLRRLGRRHPTQSNLVVLTSGINFIDMEGAESLANEARRRRNEGGELFFVGVKDAVASVLERTGFMDVIGRDHVFESKKTAFSTIYARLDRDICATCTKRIFLECGSDPVEDAPAHEQHEQASQPAAAPMAPAAPPIVRRPRPTLMPGPKKSPQGPERILALIEHDDEDQGAHDTVAEAGRLAQETDADLALGQLVNWKMGSASVFPEGFVSHEMETALCAPARRHLEQLADDLGIDEAAVLACATADRAEAAVKLIGEWCPDLIVVHARSNFSFARLATAEFETPFGRIRCKIRRAGTA